jgi:hypothetical protein
MVFRHTLWLLVGASFCVCSTALAGDYNERATTQSSIQKTAHDTQNTTIGKMMRTAPSGGKQVSTVKSSKGTKSH